MIRPLSPDEITSPAFRHLLWLACEVGDDALDVILRDELPALTVLGTVTDGSADVPGSADAPTGCVTSFIAVDAATDPVVIEYIAVDEDLQGSGTGSRLVAALRGHCPDRVLYAETDDDAVDFYRRAGFTVTDASPRPPVARPETLRLRPPVATSKRWRDHDHADTGGRGMVTTARTPEAREQHRRITTMLPVSHFRSRTRSVLRSLAELEQVTVLSIDRHLGTSRFPRHV